MRRHSKGWYILRDWGDLLDKFGLDLMMDDVDLVKGFGKSLGVLATRRSKIR